MMNAEEKVNAYPVVSCGFCLEVFPQRLRKGECQLLTLFDGQQCRSKRRLPLLPASSHPETARVKDQSAATKQILLEFKAFIYISVSKLLNDIKGSYSTELPQ